MQVLGFVRQYKQATLTALTAIDETQVVEVIRHLETARRRQRQVFLCGNGGSAATSSHFSCELGKEGSWGKPFRFRVISLADNVPWMTAIANDADYRLVFVEQLKNFARRGDLLLAFSTSGNSANVIEAVVWGNRHGLQTIGFTGLRGGRLKNTAQDCLQVRSNHTGVIQEGHFLIQHLISYYFIELQAGKPEQAEATTSD